MARLGQEVMENRAAGRSALGARLGVLWEPVSEAGLCERQ